jgi:hypothetical protein
VLIVTVFSRGTALAPSISRKGAYDENKNNQTFGFLLLANGFAGRRIPCLGERLLALVKRS